MRLWARLKRWWVSLFCPHLFRSYGTGRCELCGKVASHECDTLVTSLPWCRDYLDGKVTKEQWLKSDGTSRDYCGTCGKEQKRALKRRSGT